MKRVYVQYQWSRLYLYTRQHYLAGSATKRNRYSYVMLSAWSPTSFRLPYLRGRCCWTKFSCTSLFHLGNRGDGNYHKQYQGDISQKSTDALYYGRTRSVWPCGLCCRGAGRQTWCPGISPTSHSGTYRGRSTTLFYIYADNPISLHSL